MILGVGIDVVDIARFGETLERTPRDAGRGCSRRPSGSAPLASLAARFAAKEALAKALGRADRDALAGRRDRQRGRPATRASTSAARCRPAPTSSGWRACTSRCPTTRASRPRWWCWSMTMALAAGRFEAFGGAALRAARAVPRGCGRRWCCSAASQRRAGPGADFGRVLAVAIACVAVPSQVYQLTPWRLRARLVAAAAAVRLRVGDGARGRCGRGPGADRARPTTGGSPSRSRASFTPSLAGGLPATRGSSRSGRCTCWWCGRRST